MKGIFWKDCQTFSILWNPKFITLHTRIRHWSVSWIDLIQPTFSNTASVVPVLILSFLSITLIRLLNNLSRETFRLWLYTHVHLPWVTYVHLLYHPPFDHPNNICWKVHVLSLLIMQFSRSSCYSSPTPCSPISILRLCGYQNVTKFQHNSKITALSKCTIPRAIERNVIK
jgi:hypothetical protein